MALTCGIVGLSNVGKTTLFNCFSNTKAEVTEYAYSVSKSNMGIAHVPDPRLKELLEIQESQKIIPTTVDIVDIPGVSKSTDMADKSANKFLGDLRNTDAIIHVLRCFDNENLPHVEGSVNPVRDIELLDFELQVKDLDSIEKKKVRYQKLIKIGDKDAKAGLATLIKAKEHVENFESIRTLELTDSEKKHLTDMQLLTAKPVMYVCNVDEAAATAGNSYTKEVTEKLSETGSEILIIAGALEAEIAEFDTEEEKIEFLNDYGLKEPGINRLLRSAYNLLDLKTFFTVGPKEIHAWTMKNGYTAPQAAGVIHSDLERGFIRAEVMKYADFIALGGENACKDAGKLHVEGKNYEVGDGDILNIRFNV